MFDPQSRYYDPSLPNETYLTSDGRRIPYRPLRTVPKPETIPVLTEVDSKTGERADQLAARTLGNAEESWRLYDLNLVIDPLSISTRWSQRWKVPGA